MKKIYVILTALFIFISISGCQKIQNSTKQKPSNSKNIFTDLKPTLLKKPPFKYYLAKQNNTVVEPIKLVLKSEKPNQIIDDKNWFIKNGLSMPEYQIYEQSDEMDALYGKGKLPLTVKKMAKKINAKIMNAISFPNETFLLLGIYDSSEDFDYETYDEPLKNYLIKVDSGLNKVTYALDFTDFMIPPIETLNDMFSKQTTNWAVEDDKTLFVSHAGGGYAKDTKGMNAYITAIDLSNNKIIWRSQPLISYPNFLIVGDTIISGYGFSMEPDYLYLINKYTGKVIQRIPVKSAPSYLILKGDLLYVRTYDHDYVFKIIK